jgi:hypothetical protein
MMLKSMKRAGLAFQGGIDENKHEGLTLKFFLEVPGACGVFGGYLLAAIGQYWLCACSI